MKFSTLLFRNLIHNRRTNLAVLLGAAVGTAVLGGALLVGDSVRGSLRDLTLDRLGRTDHAVIADRFFSDELAQAVEANGKGRLEATQLALLQGTVSHAESRMRATKVNVLGVNERFWSFGKGSPAELPTGREVILNEALASEIGASPGDAVLIRVEKQTAIPRDSTLGKRSETVSALRLEVKGVIPNEGVGRFGLKPSQHLPRNAYVPLPALQKAIDQAGRSNALLIANAKDEGEAALTEPGLKDLLTRSISLGDLELLVRKVGDEELTSVESRRLLIEPAAERLILSVAKRLDLRTTPVLSYLANSISKGKGKPEAGIPYSLLCALDLDTIVTSHHLALKDGGKAPAPGEDEVLLNDWAADDLAVDVGDEVRITFLLAAPTTNC